MDKMNLLTTFFFAIQDDGRISTTHIAVYSALLQFWITSGQQNPVRAFSHQIMEIAKVSAPMTYRKCLKDLSDFGYLRYVPSYKRNRPSEIYLTDL